VATRSRSAAQAPPLARRPARLSRAAAISHPAAACATMPHMPVLLLALLAVIALLVVGWAVVGLVWNLVWWALGGLVIGALGRLVIPGRQPIGLGLTALAGIGGGLLGGVVAREADLGGLTQFLVAIVAAAGLVLAASAWAARSREPAGAGGTVVRR
jgi:uncharacterized membrane protein YeaQ/YmgE (transglycosylase-associated protein family)